MNKRRPFRILLLIIGGCGVSTTSDSVYVCVGITHVDTPALKVNSGCAADIIGPGSDGDSLTKNTFLSLFFLFLICLELEG